jgi:hypothetical protein
MSRKARFPEDELLTVFQELLEPMEEVITRVASRLPTAFPASVAESIFDGMRRAKAKTETLL